LFEYNSDGELIEDQPHESKVKTIDDVEWSAIDEIMDEHTHTKPKPNVIDSLSYSYTYTGEHYDTIPRDAHWTKQFASTELAVNVTSAISYAVRDGLDNKDVAVVLGKILNEVKQRQ
jgi:hypothetical protein